MSDKKNQPVTKNKKKQKTYNQQLSQLQFRAVEYYVRGMTKKDALIKAGYSPVTAGKAAWTIFNRRDVKAAIEERRWKMKSRSNKIVDRVQEELARVAFFNIGSLLEITENGDFIYNFKNASMEDFAAIGEVTVEAYKEGRGEGAKEVKRVKIKPYDKKAALDSLARIHGMFDDKLTVHDGPGGSLEEKLAAGRKRLNQPDVIEGDFKEVSFSIDTSHQKESDDEKRAAS